MTTSPWLSPWHDRLELGEGPRWVDGRLVLVDILAGRLLQATDGDSLQLLAQLPVPLGAVAPVDTPEPSWIAAAGTGIALLSPTGDPTWLAADLEQHAATPMRMNDAVADPHGRFWAGTMAYDITPGAGSLYRVDPDGTITRALTGITIPNGPAFDADGTTMYLADSARSLIHRYRVDPATGELHDATVFTRTTTGGPDGMTVDAEGCLWSAIWGAGAVHRYRQGGTLDQVLTLPAQQPAGVCLGGPDLRTLYITTATEGLAHPGPLDGAVLTTRVDVPGLPTASYRRTPTP